MITHLYNMFITHIEVDFPTFGIKDTFYFPKHFIEMDNGNERQQHSILLYQCLQGSSVTWINIQSDLLLFTSLMMK